MAMIKPPIPLEDIVLSPAQGFWPLAPGWWVLIVLCLGLVSWLSYALIKKRIYQNFYHKQLKIIDRLEKYLRNDELAPHEMFKVLNRILKLYLIHYAKDSSVISLTGNSFKKWVDNKSKISADLNPIFDDSIYKQTISENDSTQKSALNSISQFRLLLQQLDELFKRPEEIVV
jgi:hypothetical protein